LPLESRVSVVLEATVSPSENPAKVLRAVKNIIGEVPCEIESSERGVRVRSSSAKSLDLLRDQLRDRRVRGAAKRRLLLGQRGEEATIMFNRQAASAGVLALCDSEQESPLGPIYLTIRSERIDGVIDWLTDLSQGSPQSV
jgi:predicted RNA binding protein with dsRBD fold (UPF0201 family)